MTDQIVSTLQQNLRGRLIGPSDADYDTARALYNGMVDKRPRLIALCVDVANVIAAVNFGRDQGCLSPSVEAATVARESARVKN
jgi:hypothetical protein